MSVPTPEYVRKLHAALSSIDFLEDRIVVLPDVPKDTFDGSRILKPDTVKSEEKVDRGVIVSAGTGRKVYETGVHIPIDVRLVPGARVMFARYAGVDQEIMGTKFKVIREADIIGIVKAGVDA